jgi:hypothetical protein
MNNFLGVTPINMPSSGRLGTHDSTAQHSNSMQRGRLDRHTQALTSCAPFHARGQQLSTKQIGDYTQGMRVGTTHSSSPVGLSTNTHRSFRGRRGRRTDATATATATGHPHISISHTASQPIRQSGDSPLAHPTGLCNSTPQASERQLLPALLLNGTNTGDLGWN